MSLQFRLAEESDAEAILAIYAPFCESTPVSFEAEPPSLAEMQRRIRAVQEKWAWIVCEENGSILGYAYGTKHRERWAYQWSVEAAIYLGAQSRRRGLGRALCECLFSILALQNYARVYGGVTLPNPGSVGLLEAMGFQKIGVFHQIGHKLGKWHDVAWYERELQPLSDNPPEPVAVATLPSEKLQEIFKAAIVL